MLDVKRARRVSIWLWGVGVRPETSIARLVPHASRVRVISPLLYVVF